MLTALALDDEPKALQVIQLLAGKVSFLRLQAQFTNAFDALAYLQQHPVDLLFVDVSMPDITGVEFVQGLAAPPLVIFTTAHSDYAVQGFELNAVDYLLKPFSLARFTAACAKALERKTLRGEKQRAHILVKSGYEEQKLFLDEILYVEADGNYLTYVLTTRRVLTRQTLAEAQLMLPPPRFLRVHRSYIIALDRVEKLARHDITVANVTIPVGASYEGIIAVIRAALNRTSSGWR
jgi:DNA-binding LytR/AlgR family response regulator